MLYLRWVTTQVVLLLCSVETLKVWACIIKTITALGKNCTLEELYINHHDPEIHWGNCSHFCQHTSANQHKGHNLQFNFLMLSSQPDSKRHKSGINSVIFLYSYDYDRKLEGEENTMGNSALQLLHSCLHPTESSSKSLWETLHVKMHFLFLSS